MTTAAALLRPHYPRLRLPVAILSGDADAVVDPREQSCRLHGEIAGSTLTLLPGKGHMIHYGAAARIARLVDGQMALTGRACAGNKPAPRHDLRSDAQGLASARQVVTAAGLLAQGHVPWRNSRAIDR